MAILVSDRTGIKKKNNIKHISNMCVYSFKKPVTILNLHLTNNRSLKTHETKVERLEEIRNIAIMAEISPICLLVTGKSNTHTHTHTKKTI